jgi:hypothetical protein
MRAEVRPSPCNHYSPRRRRSAINDKITKQFNRAEIRCIDLSQFLPHSPQARCLFPALAAALMVMSGPRDGRWLPGSFHFCSAGVRKWRESEVSGCAPHVRLLTYTGAVRHTRRTSKMIQSGPFMIAATWILTPTTCARRSVVTTTATIRFWTSGDPTASRTAQFRIFKHEAIILHRTPPRTCAGFTGSTCIVIFNSTRRPNKFRADAARLGASL